MNAFGIYRGQIESVNDPEQRYRYRVRVFQFHDATFLPETLPWAETCMPTSKLSGSFRNFENHDLVWIQFEGGDTEYPVILGGWISASQGLSDVPGDVGEDYVVTRQRNTQIDRVGNIIETSEVSGEKWVKFRSGNAEVVLTQTDDSITVRTSGRVRVEAVHADIVTKSVTVDSGEITINARGVDDITGLEEGVVNIFSNKDVILHASGSAQAKISMGQYHDSLGLPRQTPKVEILGQTVIIGAALPYSPDLPTLNVEINASSQVKVVGATKVDLQSPVEVAILGTTKVSITSSAQVDLTAPLINLSGQVSFISTGTLTLQASGLVSIQASTLTVTASVAVTLTAPTINITGAAVNVG